MNRSLADGHIAHGRLARTSCSALRIPTIMFDCQPTLIGTLLELRPLRTADWEGLFAAASDPLIWEQHPDPERYKEHVFRQFFADALKSRGALVAIERASGRIVGSSRYHGVDEEQSEVEIGWSFLARRCWGGRYNGEMKRLMLEHAFKTVERVVFWLGRRIVDRGAPWRRSVVSVSGTGQT